MHSSRQQKQHTWGCTNYLSRPLHKSSPFVSTATVHPKWFKEWDRQQVRERSIRQGVVRADGGARAALTRYRELKACSRP